MNAVLERLRALIIREARARGFLWHEPTEPLRHNAISEWKRFLFTLLDRFTLYIDVDVKLSVDDSTQTLTVEYDGSKYYVCDKLDCANVRVVSGSCPVHVVEE